MTAKKVGKKRAAVTKRKAATKSVGKKDIGLRAKAPGKPGKKVAAKTPLVRYIVLDGEFLEIEREECSFTLKTGDTVTGYIRRDNETSGGLVIPVYTQKMRDAFLTCAMKNESFDRLHKGMYGFGDSHSSGQTAFSDDDVELHGYDDIDYDDGYVEALFFRAGDVFKVDSLVEKAFRALVDLDTGSLSDSDPTAWLRAKGMRIGTLDVDHTVRQRSRVFKFLSETKGR
jgi:hypothetical protein